MSNSLFGFRDRLGTRDALFCYKVLAQHCLDVNKEIYVCFIDYEKAFDKVKYGKSIELQVQLQIDRRDLRIEGITYNKQPNRIKLEEKYSETINIKREVRHGRVLSLLLFNRWNYLRVNQRRNSWYRCERKTD